MDGSGRRIRDEADGVRYAHKTKCHTPEDAKGEGRVVGVEVRGGGGRHDEGCLGSLCDSLHVRTAFNTTPDAFIQGRSTAGLMAGELHVSKPPDRSAGIDARFLLQHRSAASCAGHRARPIVFGHRDLVLPCGHCGAGGGGRHSDSPVPMHHFDLARYGGDINDHDLRQQSHWTRRVSCRGAHGLLKCRSLAT